MRLLHNSADFVASVAQLEEHQIVVLVVMGSIPIRRPIGLWSPPQETVPVVRRQAISFLSPFDFYNHDLKLQVCHDARARPRYCWKLLQVART